MDDQELFELVRRNYSEANKEYIEQQIKIAQQCGGDEQHENT